MPPVKPTRKEVRLLKLLAQAAYEIERLNMSWAGPDDFVGKNPVAEDIKRELKRFGMYEAVRRLEES